MSEAVKTFKAKVKELAAFVESNEAESYLTPEFLGRLTELRELTDIIKIDLTNSRKGELPIFAPNSVYVPVAPTENLAPFVAEETAPEAPKAKVEKKVEIVEPVVEATVVEEVNVESSTDTGETTEASGATPSKAVKPKSKA